MVRTRIAGLFMIAALGLAGCATAPPAGAVQPPAVVRVDPARFYDGVWHEFARRPSKLTDGCVAATTTYRRIDARKVAVRDACHQGGPQGRLREIKGVGRILDPGVDGVLRVRYLGVIVWEYRVIAVDPDHQWFISTDPSFHKLFIFTRDPTPSDALKARMVDEARSLGFPVDQLEFL